MGAGEPFDIEHELVDKRVRERMLDSLEAAYEHFFGKAVDISFEMILYERKPLYNILRHSEVNQS